jgi:hypothetical protein
MSPKTGSYSVAASIAPSFTTSTIPPSSSRSSVTSSSDTDYTSSIRSPSLGFASPKPLRYARREARGFPSSHSGYSPGIEKVEEDGGSKRDGSIMNFGSETGEGSQYGSDYRQESSIPDLRREALAQDSRNEALPNQRGFPRQHSTQDLRPDSRARTSSRQTNSEFDRLESNLESRQMQNNHKFVDREVSHIFPQPPQTGGNPDFRPLEHIREYRHTDSTENFGGVGGNQNFRPGQKYNGGYDNNAYQGIRDFDDYRI